MAGAVHPAPVAAVPAAPRVDGATLARMVGGTHSVDSYGRAEVVFPNPLETGSTTSAAVSGQASGSPTGSPPYTAARGLPARRQIARAVDGEPASADSAVTAPAQAAAPQAADTRDAFVDIYERVVEQLRRDLIVERERIGDLTGALFR